MTSVPCPTPSLWAVTLPAVQFHQVLDQRQADAQAALRAVERLVGLREQVEDVRQESRGDARALVLHRDLQLAVGVGGAQDDAAYSGPRTSTRC